MPAKIATCDCGCIVDVTRDSNGDYRVCELVCPKCGQRSSGGNFRTGEVTGWMTQEQVERANAEFAAMQYDADMNEWYGRREW